jgi:predicted homoserine dehydrogenase-like protein
VFDLPRRLAARDVPVRVGVIGAGTFGRALTDSAAAVAGLRVAGVADLDRDRAARMLRGAGADPERTDDPAAVHEAVAAGRPVVTADATALIRSDIDVVLEATGVPAAGARHASEAILADTHVVMATVEADTVVGPTLARLADRAGVVYTHAYGDQPALTVELVAWARLAGFEVVVAGQGRNLRAEDRYGTPDDALERFGFSPEYVAEHDPNPRLYNSFLDGTKMAVESCAVANATGLPPDTRGMHVPTAEIAEIPDRLCPEADGGLLAESGVVDAVSTVHPDGSTTDTGFPYGVFVVVRAPSERASTHLHEGVGGGEGVVTSADGAYALFYRPYHLPGVETTVSVAQAAVRGEPTGTARGRVAEAVAAAKRDLDPGERIAGGGGDRVYGLVERAGATPDAVPLELLDGAELCRPVARDQTLTYADVDLDRDSFLYHLRALGDELSDSEAGSSARRGS